MSGFSLFFAGAEVPSWKKLLTEQGAQNIAISYWGLRKRLPKTKPYLLADRYPEDQRIFLDSGGFSANRTAGEEDWDAYLAEYRAFVERNVDRLEFVSEFDCVHLPAGRVARERVEFWDGIPDDKFLPIWHLKEGFGVLEDLAQRYERVGIHESVFDHGTEAIHRLNTVVQRYGTLLHGVGITKPHLLEQARFATASSTSWLSPIRFGDTVVWDGNCLRRYPAKHKQQARKRHRMMFTKYGFDAERIEADDHAEVARFTLWSWLQLEAHVSKRKFTRTPRDVEVSDNNDNVRHLPIPEPSPSHAANRGEGTRNGGRTPIPRERTSLPVFGVTPSQEEGNKGERIVAVNQRSLRRCDNCHISASCPAFNAGHECAFDFPLEVRTKTQLLALLRGMIEMQSHRVAFMRMSEELEGGYADPNLSIEVDRLFGLVEKLKDIEDNRDFLKMTVEARSNGGLISRLFGAREGEMVQALPRPMATAEVDRVIEGEVLDT